MNGTCLGSLSSSEGCGCWWVVFTRQSGCCVISCFHHQSHPSHTPQPAPDWDRYKGALQFDSYQLESPSISSARPLWLFDGVFLHLTVFRNDNEDAGWTGATGYVQFSPFTESVNVRLISTLATAATTPSVRVQGWNPVDSVARRQMETPRCQSGCLFCYIWTKA